MLGKANANDFFLLSRNNKKAPPREEKESDQEKYEVSNEWVASFVENAKCLSQQVSDVRNNKHQRRCTVKPLASATPTM